MMMREKKYILEASRRVYIPFPFTPKVPKGHHSCRRFLEKIGRLWRVCFNLSTVSIGQFWYLSLSPDAIPYRTLDNSVRPSKTRFNKASTYPPVRLGPFLDNKAIFKRITGTQQDRKFPMRCHENNRQKNCWIKIKEKRCQTSYEGRN